MKHTVWGVWLALALAVGCGNKDDKKTIAAKPPAKAPGGTAPTAEQPATKPIDAAPAKAAKPVDAAPKPFVLTEKECKQAVGRSYALMRRYNPKKLTKKQKKDVADYVSSSMEGVSLTNCRRNSRAWYDCKMKAKKHFEAEDCNMIDADESDGPPP